jgi:hypothetical protein
MKADNLQVTLPTDGEPNATETLPSFENPNTSKPEAIPAVGEIEARQCSKGNRL